eukprot:358478-Chlamydomonas_euryale.AAC.20
MAHLLSESERPSALAARVQRQQVRRTTNATVLHARRMLCITPKHPQGKVQTKRCVLRGTTAVRSKRRLGKTATQAAIQQGTTSERVWSCNLHGVRVRAVKSGSAKGSCVKHVQTDETKGGKKHSSGGRKTSMPGGNTARKLAVLSNCQPQNANEKRPAMDTHGCHNVPVGLPPA